MLKKTLLVAALTAATPFAFASGFFYAGAGAGADSVSNKASVYSNLGSNGDVDYGKTGVLGGLFGGYNYGFANNVNLGAELFANATSTKITDNSGSPYDVTFKSRYNYGLRVLPGYNITPYIESHLIAGFVRGNFQDTLATTKTFNANGFQAGIGGSAAATKNVYIRADLIYSGYQSKTTTDNEGNIFKNQIHTVDSVVSVLYRFG